MNDIGIDPGRIEIGAPSHCSEYRYEIFWTAEGRRIQSKSADLKMRFIQFLIAERPDIHVHDLCQFPAQVVHMHTGSSVRRRRILVR
jgi:hypothetical protein